MKTYIDSRIKSSTSWDAEDVLQEVAAKIFSLADRRTPIQNIGGFVYRSIKNKIIDIRRKKTITSSADDLENKVFELMDVAMDEDGHYSEAMKTKLEGALKSLKPHYHDIIIAIDIEGYSYKEIAVETGIPEGTLMSRRHRALAKLAEELEQRI